jgi:formate dehydrogenase major subunit
VFEVIINGQRTVITEESSVLRALTKEGIQVPSFCYDERFINRHFPEETDCGLCVVEINGKLEKSCSTVITDGMVILSDSDKVIERRRSILERIIEDHPLDCIVCDKSGECKLQDYCYEYGIEKSYNSCLEALPVDDSSPFFSIDPNKCIACGKCVKVCAYLQNTNILFLTETNGKRHVAVNGETLRDSACGSCGNCVSVCPVGALLPKGISGTRADRWKTETVQTTCCYCGVGCQIDLKVAGNKILGAGPAASGPNDGLLCVKGKFGYKFISHSDRLKTPLIRQNGQLTEATWDEAYALITEKISAFMASDGPDAFAGLTSARCTNEENYLFQKLFRTVIGTNNIDHCARL